MRRTLWRLSIGIAILSTAISIAGEPAYRQAVLDDEPLFYWTFDEDGDTDPAINIMAPDRAEDELIAQGAATRVDHDAIGSDPMLGRAADFDGAHGTRFYAPDVGGSAAVPGANFVPSQLWAIEFWFQVQGSLAGNRGDYFLESIGASSNDPGLIFDFTPENYIEMFKGARTATAGPQVEDTEWHHVIFAFYGNNTGFGVANRRDIILDGEMYTDRASAFSSGFALVQLAVGNTVAGGGVNGFEGNIDEMAIYDVGTMLIEQGLDVSFQNEDAELAFEDFLLILSDHVEKAGQPGYGDEILSLDPLFYWTFDEEGDTDDAVNLADPGDVRDHLVAQGATTRIDHADIGSGLQLGRSASFNGANGTRFYAADIDAATGAGGLDVIPSQLWALEFWFQAQGQIDGVTRADYFVESLHPASSNDPGIIFDYTEPNYIEMFRGARTGTAGPQLNDTAWHHAVFAFYGNNGGFGVANRRDIILDGRFYTERASAFSSGFALVQLAVGNTVAGGGQNPFQGRMDEVALYDVGTKLKEAGYSLSPQNAEAEDAFEAFLIEIADHRKLVAGFCQEETDTVVIQGPDIGEVNGPAVTLAAVFTGADPGSKVSYTWSVVSGTGTLTDKGDGTATLASTVTGSVRVAVEADDGVCPDVGAATARFTVCFEKPDDLSISGPDRAGLGVPVTLTAEFTGADPAYFVDNASGFSSGFALVQYAVGNTVAGGGVNGFEGRMDEMAIYDIGTKLADMGFDISTHNPDAEEAFQAIVREIASHARLRGTAYADAVLDAEPELYWDFNEEGGAVEAANIIEPDNANDWLLPQGAATRVSHDDIGSGLDLGNAAAFDGANGTRFYATDLKGPEIGPGLSYIASQLWVLEFWFQAQGDVVTGTRADYFVECIGATSNDPGIIFDYTEPNYIEMFRGERTGTAGPQIHDTAWHHAVFAFYGNRGGFGVANKREIIIDGGEFVTYSWSVAIGAADLVDNGDGTASVTPTGVPGDLVQVRVEASDGACGSIAAVHTIIVGEEEIRFVRADDNASGRVDLADPIYSLNYQFASGPAPPCMAAADTNGSGQVDLADPIFSLNYQFASGPVPPAPFPACGADPKLGLPCESFRPCQ